MHHTSRLIVLVALIAACSGREVPITPGGNTSVDAGSPKTDGGPRRCSPACTSAQECVDGQCILKACDDGLTRCGALCLDTSSDVQHCGTCTKVCPSSNKGLVVCSEGECGLHCTADEDDAFCAPPSKCSGNHCCGQGEVWCEDQGKCVATLTDLDNCGGCGRVCSAMSHGSASCSGGTCTVSCNTPYERCENICSNYAIDPNNCGSCGRSCGVGAGCAGGQCVVATVTCTIGATSGWQNCGSSPALSVMAGDALYMSAAGSWSITSPAVNTGPEGTGTNPGTSGGDFRYSGNYNYGALLWRVSTSALENGGFFSSMEMSYAPNSGQLQFRINDGDSSIVLFNNSGSMSVTVKVTRL